MKILLLFMALIPFSTQAQIVVGSTFKPRSFDEYSSPYMMYKKAYDEAIWKFGEYFEKEQIEFEKFKNGERYSPSLGLFYIKKCIDLNNQFNGVICDGGTLYFSKGIWHLINNEKNQALQCMKYAWEKYKNEKAKEVYNQLISE